MATLSRRTVLGGLAVIAANGFAFARALAAAPCSFRLGVINDEISPDFDHACYVAAHDFGLSWIELRSMWGKNATELDASQIQESLKILKKYKLRVSDIASPLFKTDFPGAPASKLSEDRDRHLAKVVDFKEQDALLEHCIELSHTFGTDRIRCFDFWRLEDQKPYRAAINDKLREASVKCAKTNLVLLLENEASCNTATGPEALEVLNAVPNKNFMLNWDPGNSATFAGDIPYPNDYGKLPKERIGHVHVKNIVHSADGKHAWSPVDVGEIDWVGQLKALQRDRFKYTVSLETHWKGGGTPEQCTRVSMAGLQKCLAQAGLDCPRG